LYFYDEVCIFGVVHMKRKSYWVDNEDEAAIAQLKERYGCESDSQVIRFALRVLANSPMLAVSLPDRPKHARRSPKTQPTTPKR
jgi:hypothetical protein